MRIFIIFIICLFSQIGLAKQVGVFGGVNYSNGDFKANGQSVDLDSELGFQVGARYVHDMQDQLGFRSGGQLNFVNSSVGANGVSLEVSTIHLQIPATLQYEFAEQFAAFAGLGMNLLIDNDCKTNVANTTSCGALDFSSMYIDFQLGAMVRPNDFFAFEFFYQLAVTDVAEYIDTNIFGLQFIWFL